MLKTGLVALAQSETDDIGSAPFEAGEFDLAVDLGHQIGSLRWWRGLATLGTMLTAASWLAFTNPIQPLPSATSSSIVTIQQAQVHQPSVIGPLMSGAQTGERVAMLPLAKPIADEAEPVIVQKEVPLARGGSLEAVLRRAGVSRTDARMIVEAVGPAGELKDPPRGATLQMILGRRVSSKDPRPLEMLSFRPSFDQHVQVARVGGEFLAKAVPIQVVKAPARVEGEVGGSLYVSARKLGVPASVLSQYIKALSYTVDFAREVAASDRFSLVYEREVAETGEEKSGRLLYANLERGGKRSDVELTWFEPKGERGQFFHPDGASIQKLLMRTPVDGARISSNFGMRRHPVLGYGRMHKGMDFAAPSGTPIMASGSGTVVFAGRHGGHGNYVKIRHSGGYETAYAHMKGFKSGIRRGVKVGQGQVIGYVGSTGLSTGPHLHYEVYKNGKAINPAGSAIPTGASLRGTELVKFKAEVQKYRSLPKNQAAEQVLVAAGINPRKTTKQPG